MIYQMVGLAVKSIEMNEHLQNMLNNHLEYNFEGIKKSRRWHPPYKKSF